MMSHLSWLIPGFIGLQFTLLAVLKLCGLNRGIVGGAEKPFVVKLCGS